MIIGLTGSFGAGCTTTANFFRMEKGFLYLSLSSILKGALGKKLRNKKEWQKRELMQDFGDDLRKREGSDVLAKKVIQKVKQIKLKNIIIDSIRNPSEIEAFRKYFEKFYLIAIDAPKEVRRDRLKAIYKAANKRFDIDDSRDSGIEQPEYGQHLKKCIEMADILINNEKSFFNAKHKANLRAIDEYAQKMSDYSDLLENPACRAPNLDEIYMHYACSISLRSSCLKRQVGAVIVRELEIGSYIIAAGCNNVPLGEVKCINECYRDKQKREYFSTYKYCRSCGSKLEINLKCSNCQFDNSELLGKLLDICRAVHAEEAAILQAARLGTELNNAKLYTSLFPCMLCCKQIIDAGIKDVIYLEAYPMQGSQAIQMFKNSNTGVNKFEGVTSIAFNNLFKRNID